MTLKNKKQAQPKQKENVTRNYFRENRLAVLKGIENSGFLTPLTQADLPLKISENNKDASLKEVVIDNVPADEDDIRPRSWILNLEMPKPVFGSIQHTKTTEKALIVLGVDALRIFMFELKSSLLNKTAPQQSVKKGVRVSSDNKILVYADVFRQIR